MSVVEVNDVTFAYTDAPVLDNVSLTIEPGTFLGLVGPNGSGKSTLLKLMLGLARPSSGSVTLFDEPAHTFEDGERIAYVSQHVATRIQDMPITVREAVTMGRYPRRLVGRFSEADRSIVDEALEQTGLSALAPRRVGRLSGGQRQRVFIARALTAGADLLALDEPTIGVDVDARERFYDLLRELHADGLTIILIEHDIGVVTTYTTEIACLNRRLYFHGNPEEFVTTGAMAKAYGADQYVLQHDH